MDPPRRRCSLCRYHRLRSGATGRHRIVDIPTEGETLEAGEVFGTIEVVKTISDLFLPVAGEVVEQNPALEENPELVNKDPYGEGWLIKMKPANAADLDNLLDAEGYKAVVNA